MITAHYGQGAGQAVSLAQQALRNAEIFRSVRRVVVLELPWTGWSGAHSEAHSTADAEDSGDHAFAAVIKQVLDVCAAQTAIIVAPCVSGPAAAALAASCPDLVAGLVLVDPPVLLPSAGATGTSIHCRLLRKYLIYLRFPVAAQLWSVCTTSSQRSANRAQQPPALRSQQPFACAAYALSTRSCCSLVPQCACFDQMGLRSGAAPTASAIAEVALPPPGLAAAWAWRAAALQSGAISTYSRVPPSVPVIALFATEAMGVPARQLAALIPHAIVRCVDTPGGQRHFCEFYNPGAVLQAVAHVIQLAEDNGVVGFLTRR